MKREVGGGAAGDHRSARGRSAGRGLRRRPTATRGVRSSACLEAIADPRAIAVSREALTDGGDLAVAATARAAATARLTGRRAPPPRRSTRSSRPRSIRQSRTARAAGRARRAPGDAGGRARAGGRGASRDDRIRRPGARRRRPHDAAVPTPSGRTPSTATCRDDPAALREPLQHAGASAPLGVLQKLIDAIREPRGRRHRARRGRSLAAAARRTAPGARAPRQHAWRSTTCGKRSSGARARCRPPSSPRCTSSATSPASSRSPPRTYAGGHRTTSAWRQQLDSRVPRDRGSAKKSRARSAALKRIDDAVARGGARRSVRLREPRLDRRRRRPHLTQVPADPLGAERDVPDGRLRLGLDLRSRTRRCRTSRRSRSPGVLPSPP